MQLRLDRPVAAAEGDRVVLRTTAPQATVAGGIVLDPAPTRSGRAPQPVAIAAASPARTLSAEAPTSSSSGWPSSRSRRPRCRLPTRRRRPIWPTPAGIVRAGRDLAFTTAAYEQARDAAVEIASAGGTVTIAQLRDRLGCSRRYAQALLEAMDGHGITRRVGDERVLRRRARGEG